jgi:hypothetical protein
LNVSALNALKEVESALETYARGLERRALLESARQKATRAAQDTEHLFKLGRQGYLPVLDATRTLIAVEQSVAAVDSKLGSDQVNLFLGRRLGRRRAGSMSTHTKAASTLDLNDVALFVQVVQGCSWFSPLELKREFEQLDLTTRRIAMNAPGTAQGKHTGEASELYMAFELGEKNWKLLLSDGARSPSRYTVAAGARAHRAHQSDSCTARATEPAGEVRWRAAVTALVELPREGASARCTLVEQAAAAAHSLEEQTPNLVAAVAVLKLPVADTHALAPVVA